MWVLPAVVLYIAQSDTKDPTKASFCQTLMISLIMHMFCLCTIVAGWSEHLAATYDPDPAMIGRAWWNTSLPFIALFTWISSFVFNMQHLRKILSPNGVVVVWFGPGTGLATRVGQPPAICDDMAANLMVPADFHPRFLDVSDAGQQAANGTYEYIQEPHHELPAYAPLLARGADSGTYYYKHRDNDSKSIIYYDECWKLSTSGNTQSHEYVWQLRTEDRESKPKDHRLRAEPMQWKKSTVMKEDVNSDDDKCIVTVADSNDWDLHLRAMHVALVPVFIASIALYADAWAVRETANDGGPKVNCHCNITPNAGNGTISHAQEVCVSALLSMFYKLNMVLADFYVAYAVRSLGVLVFEFLRRKNFVDSSIKTYYGVLIDMFWICAGLRVIAFYGLALLTWYVDQDLHYDFYDGFLAGCLNVGLMTTVYGLYLVQKRYHDKLPRGNFVTITILLIGTVVQKGALQLAIDFVDPQEFHAALICVECAILVIFHCRQWCHWRGSEVWYVK